MYILPIYHAYYIGREINTRVRVPLLTSTPISTIYIIAPLHRRTRHYTTRPIIKLLLLLYIMLQVNNNNVNYFVLLLGLG